MKAATGVALLASAGLAQAATMGRPAVSQRAAASSGQLCAEGSANEGGNWFCQAVNQVKYTGVGASKASYQDVVFMDPETGRCDKADHPIGGPLAPFDESLALFFRGPAILQKLAVYTPGTKAKRDSSVPVAEKRHGHSHNHARKHARYQHAHLHSEREAPHQVEEKREHPTIWVTATIDGQVVSWINNYWGPDTETPAPAAPAPSAPAVNTQAPAPPATTPPPAAPAPTTTEQLPGVNVLAKGSSAAADTNSKPSATSAPSSGGDYVRVANYDAATGEASGLVFLANLGGQGSGAWTPHFGNTLAYVDSTGTKGASSPQVLGNVTIPSGKEIAIYSDKPCDAASCGYWQPGSVAYQGFGQGDKTFLVEFQFPHEHGAEGDQADMSAFWALNSKIARQSQYSDCSCWSSPNPGQSGCGEFDIFEVLAPGDTKCKSTAHGPKSGGDSNYFVRPADKTVKVAVVFDTASNSISVKVIDDATVFGDSLSYDDIKGFLSTDNVSTAGGGKGASLFAISS